MTDERILGRETLADVLAELDACDRLVKECKSLVEKATRQMNAGNYARGAYAQLAGQLHDIASDFHGDEDFTRLRRMLDDHDQASGEAEEGQMRRSYYAKVL